MGLTGAGFGTLRMDPPGEGVDRPPPVPGAPLPVPNPGPGETGGAADSAGAGGSRLGAGETSIGPSLSLVELPE